MKTTIDVVFRNAHRLRLLLVLILVVLTIQAWFGDTVNIFVIPANGIGSADYSLSAFFPTILSHGPLLLWHAFEGVILFLLSFVILAFSFIWSKKKSVRICAILATFFVISAALGGLLFVFSGFQSGPNSAQMGGSFIGSYAFYFMELYFTK
ncbi:MAG: hypothetical protein ACYC7D_07340 [Nitrososphaerales archaeon]